MTSAANPPASSQSDRVYAIQYLRAIAALSVVALHAGKRVDEALPDGIAALLPLGNAGVDLFFVISGFIMWSIGSRTGTTPAGFLLRRAIRVVPPYWIATLAWVGFVTAVGYSWITITPAHLLFSMTFVPHFSPTFPDEIWPVLVPGWTLTYEMFFYLMFALSLFAPERLRLRLIVAGLAGLVALGALFPPQAAMLITFSSPLLLEFLGGCLVAALWLRHPGGAARNLLVLGVGLALLALFGPAADPHDLWSRVIGYGLPSVLILSGVAGLSGQMPRLPLLERLGDASYAIYLFHLLLVMPMSEVWVRVPSIHSGGSALMFLLTALVGASVLGLLMFRYVEMPLQRWLGGRLLPRRPAAVATSH